MRLPWPFRRPHPSEPEQATPGGAHAPAAPVGAWRDLPATPGTFGPAPLVAPVKPFSQALAAEKPPPPILGQLSHARGLEGPKGLVTGVARPKAAGAPSPAMPVQRSPHAIGRVSVAEESPIGGEPATPPAAIDRPVADAGAAQPLGSTLPARRLPVVAPEPVTPRRALTTASASSIPGPRPGLVGQPTAAAAGRKAVSALAAADEPRPQPQIQQPPPAAAPQPTVPDAPRLTLGQTRRLGLGAPIAGGPLGSSSRPAAASPVAPSVTSAPESITAPDGYASAAPDAPSPTTPPATPAAIRSVGVEPAAPPVRPVRTAPTYGPAAPSGPASRRSSALVSANPLRSGIQRSPIGAMAADPTPAAAPVASTGPARGSGSGGGPVRVHRGPEAAGLAASLDARAFTHGSDVYLPASHGPLSAGPARSLLAHELTHVVQQRQLGAGLPAESTPHGRRLEAEAVAAERSGALPLAAARPGSAGPAAASEPPTMGPQRAPEDLPHDDLGTTTIHVAAGTQRAPMSSPASSKGRERIARTEQELEDLAHQLYARIGRRLRRELLVDRERAGLGIDLR